MHYDQTVIDDLLEDWEKVLPLTFPRCEVPQLLGRIIAAGTLANYDCQKKGPEGAFRSGRKVCYRRAPFLVWLGKWLSRSKTTSSLSGLKS